MKRILIVGATGNLGPHLVKEFSPNHHLTVMTRPGGLANQEKMKPLQELGVKVVEADLTDEASLRSACQGQEVVIAAVGGEGIAHQATWVPSD